MEMTEFTIDGYTIRYSSLNWLLLEPVTRKRKNSDEEYADENILGYYDRPEAALRSLARHEITRMGKVQAESLATLIETRLNRLEATARDVMSAVPA